MRAPVSFYCGTRRDPGPRLLLAFVDGLHPAAVNAVDLGCGTGLIAAVLARARPELSVLATDLSSGAVSSALATMEANGLTLRVPVLRDDAMSTLSVASVDLIACNPPFHRGPAKDSSAALAMVSDAGRALRPGGELWLVFNSHLPYLPVAQEQVGPTRVVVRDQSYMVACPTQRRAPLSGRGDGGPAGG